MDPPTYGQQHSRYVPMSSPNPNFYANTPHPYHHHHLPPLPTPPPPPAAAPPLPPQPRPLQLHHHPLPPPPLAPAPAPAPPPPFDSQFPFNPNPNHKPNNTIPNQDFCIEADRHHYLLPQSWDHPRVVPEHRQFDHDHRPLSPFRAIEDLRYDLEPEYRLRDRERYSNDGYSFEHSGSVNSQNLPDVGPSRHAVLLTESERFNPVNYGEQFEGGSLWLRLDRQSIRERESTQTENYGDGGRFFSGKRQSHWSESGRYGNNRGTREREISHEFNRTPRKQIQKKSALLRIQQPINRNRDVQDLHYSGYTDERKLEAYRNRDQFMYSDNLVGGEIEERKGSPVELDVSFKSNSLVAKAIVTSSSDTVSDTQWTPKSVKARKLNLAGKDLSSSPMSRRGAVNMKLDSSEEVKVSSLYSNKDLKRNEEEISADKPDDNSQTPRSGISDVLSDHTTERPKVDPLNSRKSNGGTIKLSPSVSSKKRVVNLKARHTDASVSSSQLLEKVDESVRNGGSRKYAPASTGGTKGKKLLKRKLTFAGRTLDQPLCSSELTRPVEYEKDGGLLNTTMVMGDLSTDVNLGSSCVNNSKRKREGLISPMGSSPLRETKFDRSPKTTANNISELLTGSDADKNLAKSLGEIIVHESGSVEGVCKQFCHNGKSSVVEDSARVGSPEKLLSVDLVTSSDLLNSEENKRPEYHAGRCSPSHRIYAATSSYDATVSLEGEISDRVTSSSIDKNIAERNSLGILPEKPSEISTLSRSNEIGILNVSIHSNCSNHDRGSVYVCDDSVRNNIKHLAFEQSASSVKNDGREGLPNTLYLAGGCGENVPITTNCSGGTTSLFPDKSIMDPLCRSANAAISADRVDTTCANTTTALCVGGFNSAEAMFSCSLDVSLQTFPNRATIIQETNLPCRLSEAMPSVNSSGFAIAMLSEVSEGPAETDICMSGVDMSTSTGEGQILPERQTEECLTDTYCDSDLPHCWGSKTPVLCEDRSEEDSSEAVVSVDTNASKDETDGLIIDSQKVDVKNSNISRSTSGCSLEYSGEQATNSLLVVAGTNNNYEDSVIENQWKEEMDPIAEEKKDVTSEASQLKFPSEHLPQPSDEKLSGSYVHFDDDIVEKDKLTSSSAYEALPASVEGVSTTNSNNEIMELDILGDIGTTEVLPAVPVIQAMSCNASPDQVSNDEFSGDDVLPNENLAAEGSSFLSVSPQLTKNDLESNVALERPNVDLVSVRLRTSQNVKSASHTVRFRGGDTKKKNQSRYSVSNSYPSQKSLPSVSSKNTSSTYITKPLTWHRSENFSASPMLRNSQFPHVVSQQNQVTRTAQLQSTSYVRKGNSLVRKPYPVPSSPQVSHALPSSVYRLPASVKGDLKKSSGSDSGADDVGNPSTLKSVGVSAPVERPRAPLLPNLTKVKDCTPYSPDCDPLLLSDPLPVIKSEPQKLVERIHVSNPSTDASKTTINQKVSVNNLEGQGKPNDGNSIASNVKKITYVKRKSNQLVAASSYHDLPISADKIYGVKADGYYKRRKNQLIRSSSVESHINQAAGQSVDISLSDGKRNHKGSFKKNFSKRQSFKVISKISRPSRFSLVWSLSNMQSEKIVPSNHPKVGPYLIPWKRPGSWRRFMQNSVSTSNYSSLSAISRKLLLLRKRDAIYTRSGHGFSLRKSKVLSVGGSSLKWSKSIERRSKKVNEEVTLAVAAVGRKQNEQISTESIASGTKDKSHTPRERIFRVGSHWYKMDTSRRTLQRLSDDELPHAAVFNSRKDAKKSYIPRRLVIGHDEYVRIGNGNQLVRNPKKRTCALASEKVRWSLLTARLRLAKKRKYCQFFTRFGKCNKNDGKCPYIHDHSKIAVCTKYLKGLCSNSNCKLTHKVIPERMPDCSYYLQGLCTNMNCPYRHVHVNPNSSTCEGFLKGYCADGNECRKKHSYVCPIFEATGSCPQGTKCKLHHPRSQRKGKKSKQSREGKNSRGRYFGSVLTDDSKTQIMVSHRQVEQDDALCEENFGDFIALDVCGDEAAEVTDEMNEQTILCGSDNSEFQLDDLDALIKPRFLS